MPISSIIQVMKDETQNYLVRNMPVELMDKLKALIKQERRNSVGNQIIIILEDNIDKYLNEEQKK